MSEGCERLPTVCSFSIVCQQRTLTDRFFLDFFLFPCTEWTKMSDKSQKLIKIALTAGAAAVGIIGAGLIVKYHKNILQKLARTRVFERVNIPRSFVVEVINTPKECQDVVTRLRK
jgi:hypothetical protein